MIFHFGSTKVSLSFSFVALTVTMILVCNEEIVLCSFLSSFIHECGHLFFMHLTGEKSESIEMSVFGMRISRGENSGVSYKNEILISLGGIIFNLAFAVIFFSAYKLSENNLFLIIGTVNIIVATVNSFPVEALDLGRALRYVMLYREISESRFRVISCAFTVLFVFASAFYMSVYGLNISLSVVNIYLIFITVIKKWSQK